jgi:hypothetical protein
LLQSPIALDRAGLEEAGMAIAVGLLLVAAAQAAPAPAQATHTPDVEARLAAIVGDWTIPGQETSYRETCTWYGERAFVVCASTDAADGTMSQSILGYSKARGRFTYQNYAGSGTSRHELGFPHGARGIVYTDERLSDGRPARISTFVEPQPDGRLRFRQDKSVEGGPWQNAVDFYYVLRRE